MELSASKAFYWLSLSGLSVKKQTELLHHYGGPEALFARFLSDKTLAQKIDARPYSLLKRAHDGTYLSMQLETLSKKGIGVITVCNPLYPDCLKQAEVAAPYVLYYRGDLALLKGDMVAVVGTRRCDTYGRTYAQEIASALALSGAVVVSGMATGVDMFAQRAVLDAGGRTIAVLGSGLDAVTPGAHVPFMHQIVAGGGLVLSEYRPDQPATKYTYPARNRIISGLSRAVVVIEAPADSGALITARCAAEQGRDVLVLPGNADSSKHAGSNRLLYEGAVFVRGGRDVVEYLGLKTIEAEKKTRPQLDKAQEIIYSHICSGVERFDELVVACTMPPAALAAQITAMELSGAIKRLPGDRFKIVE